eukprot:gene7375-7216_t
MRAGVHHYLLQRCSPAAALCLSSVLFAALHGNAGWQQVVLVFWPGLLFGAAYQRWRDWRLCALLHGLSNASDALNGKTLYQNGPVSGGTACASCHGPSPANNVNGILRAANNPAVISSAFAANRGGMGSLFNGKFSAAELADLAAYIGNPNVTAAPVASLTPDTLTFAGTTVGQSSSALSTTLSNSGNASLNLSSLTLSGSHAADFSISGGSCAVGSPVAAAASCNVQLVFRPSAAGSRSATLNIGHNATGGVSTVSLNGSGNAMASATDLISSNG